MLNYDFQAQLQLLHILPKDISPINISVRIYYLTKKDGGMAYTINYARERDLEVVNVAKDWRDLRAVMACEP